MDKLTFVPVTITLYDENDEEINTYSKSVVRWGMLKQAIKLAKQLDGKEKDLSEENMDAISSFACRLFDDKFTKEQLEDGADISEVMACFKAVVNRASAMGNA